MDKKQTRSALKFFSTPQGTGMAKAIASGSQGPMNVILKGLGIDNPTQQDYDDIVEIANAVDYDDSAVQQKLHDTIIGTPEEYVIKAAVAATRGILDYAGQRAMNKGNMLASALIEGNRQHTAQQDAIYGLSAMDRANRLGAEKAMNKAKNTKALTDNVSKTIDKVFGDYERQNDMYKANALLQTLNNNGNRVPSTAFNWLNGIRNSSDKNRGN